ncbi:MAG: hypothetical protein PVF08_07345, partial [Gammaproteobacteria bacterium]
SILVKIKEAGIKPPYPFGHIRWKSAFFPANELPGKQCREKGPAEAQPDPSVTGTAGPNLLQIRIFEN